MTFFTTSQGIVAPNDDERVSKGAEAMRNMARTMDDALLERFSRHGGIVDGNVTATGNMQCTRMNAGELRLTAGSIVTTQSALKVYVTGAGGAVEFWGPSAVCPITIGNATNDTQAATLGQVKFIHASSKRIKKDIAPLTGDEVGAFDSLTPSSFTRTDTGDYELGFIAEDVKAAGLPTVTLPEGVVPGVEGEVLGYSDRTLIAVLWAKVQELEGRLAAVEGN